MKAIFQGNHNVEHERSLTVWKLCRRIRHALDANQTFQLKKSFRDCDFSSTGGVSGCQFARILSCALKGCLSDNEICSLVDFFKTPDMAEVAYGPFLDVVIGEDDVLVTPDRTKKILSSHEHRRLALIMMEIALALRFREQVLKPYFEDYDLIARNGGSVSVAYFKRVLYFLGITFGRSEFELLVKRFMCDNYRLDYETFINETDQLLRYLDSQGPIDRQCNKEVPSKVIRANLPKIDRPEVGTVRLDDFLHKTSAYHKCIEPSRQARDFDQLMLRIKRYVWENRIRIREFFKQYDLHSWGWISRSQFIRSMDAVGLSGLHRLSLTDSEIWAVCDRYQNPTDGDRIRWELFTDDIDKVFTVKNLDKGSYQEVTVPPIEVQNLPIEGIQDSSQQAEVPDYVNCIRKLIEARRVLIRPVFNDFDPHRNRHISRSRLGEALSMAGIFITEEQRYALEQRYSNDLGFNYEEFLCDVDPLPENTSAFKDLKSKIAGLNHQPVPKSEERDIVRVLAKVKRQAFRRKLRIIDFMRGFDPFNHFRISKDQFERGLSTAKIDVTPTEVNTLAIVFKTPLQDTVDYKRFCDTIAEIDYQSILEKAPLLVPLQHFPSEDGPHNHLNFEERTIVSRTIQKLARHSDVVSNLSSPLRDFDRNQLGLVSRNQLMRVLAIRNLHTAISNREFEVLCKCFCVEKGYRQEVNYRALLKALDYLYVNRENHPF